MGRKSAKPTKRAPRWVPRAAKKDKKGIPLTSDYRPFTLLPSDLAAAMRQPPGAPRKATRKIEPAEPTTLIPELNAIEFTPFAYQTVIEAIDASDNVQIQKLNPKGGAKSQIQDRARRGVSRARDGTCLRCIGGHEQRCQCQ